MFAGEIAFLSNFDQTAFRMPLLDVEVGSAEHAFNALKTVDPGQQRYVLEASTPSARGATHSSQADHGRATRPLAGASWAVWGPTSVSSILGLRLSAPLT